MDNKKKEIYAAVRIRREDGSFSFKLLNTYPSRSSARDSVRYFVQKKDLEYEDIVSIIHIDDITDVLDGRVHVDIYYVDSRLTPRVLPNIIPVDLYWIELKVKSKF